MASERFTGKSQRLFVQVSGQSNASPAVFIKEFELNTSFDTIEATCFGDENMVYLAGTPDASGSFAGFVDKESGLTFQAVSTQDPLKFYHYIDFDGDPTKYIYGTAIWSWTESYSRTGAAEVSGSWNAASNVLRSW